MGQSLFTSTQRAPDGGKGHRIGTNQKPACLLVFYCNCVLLFPRYDGLLVKNLWFFRHFYQPQHCLLGCCPGTQGMNVGFKKQSPALTEGENRMTLWSLVLMYYQCMMHE